MLRTRTLVPAAVLALSTLAVGCALGDAPGSRDDQAAVGSLESPLSYPDGSPAVRYESDRFRQDASGPFVQVDILVRNLSAQKQIGVRASIDGGGWTDVPARYLETLADGHERWRAEVRNGSASWSKLEYAIYYLDPVGGGAWWDNNRQKNFTLGVWDRVHRVGDSIESGKLAIELDVRNLAYEKQCAALVTTDGWITQSWYYGTYAFATEVAEVERWRVEIDLAAGNPGFGLDPKASVFEYVVTCQMAGASYWDNANTSNYRRYQAPSPSLAWSTPFEGATALAVADDGTTFAASSGGWITGYSADGTWKFAQQAPAPVRRMSWLRHAGLLLLQCDGAHPDSLWVAMGADGTVLWTLSSRLTELVAGNGAEYLVGVAGGARLGKTAPAVVGPVGGCYLGGITTGSEAFPIVSRAGRMFCLDESSTIRSYDLGTGVPGAAFVGGWPWAASDDGALVVVATDRRTLTGYGAGGNQVWKKKSLYVAVDAQYGTGKACTNHGASNLAVMLNQDPAGGAPDNHYFAGLDLATGKESFRLAATDYTLHPCAAPDGAFSYRPSYERYGRSLYRISADGTPGRINLGMYGELFDTLSDGRAVRRDWAYYPNDRGRIAVTSESGAELFSASFFDGAAASHVAALSGRYLVIAEPGKLSLLAFDSP